MLTRDVINSKARATYAARRAKHRADFAVATAATAAIDARTAADLRAAAAYTALADARAAADKVRRADVRRAGNKAADKARGASYQDTSIPPAQRDAAARDAATAARDAVYAEAARAVEEAASNAARAAEEAARDKARAAAAAACAAYARQL